MAHQSRYTDGGNFLMTVEVMMIVFMVITMMIHNAKGQTFVITVDVHLMAALSWCLQLSGTSHFKIYPCEIMTLKYKA